MPPKREEQLLAERRQIVDELIHEIYAEHKAMRDKITGAEAIISVFKWLIPIVVACGLKLIFDLISLFHK